jgi:adenosylmethionine-8-amino-7-oxononanoate aminotransferase
VRGEGVYVWDAEGNRYIDGSAGPICVNIGHGVKEVAEAVARQMEKISFAHSSHFTTESVLVCAEKLAKFAPHGMNKTYFCSGGSEAVEAAAKLARQYHLQQGDHSRYKVVARWQSYHGNTLGALSMQGDLQPGVRLGPGSGDQGQRPPVHLGLHSRARGWSDPGHMPGSRWILPGDQGDLRRVRCPVYR